MSDFYNSMKKMNKLIPVVDQTQYKAFLKDYASEMEPVFTSLERVILAYRARYETETFATLAMLGGLDNSLYQVIGDSYKDPLFEYTLRKRWKGISKLFVASHGFIVSWKRDYDDELVEIRVS